MKKNKPNRNRNGGGRATAAVTVGDRATNTENSVGNIGQSNTAGNSGGQPNGKNGGEEKKAVASVSVARVWSEGNPAPTIVTGIDRTATEKEAESRVGEEKGVEAAAELRVKGGIYTPNFPKFEILPQNSSKFHTRPHPRKSTQNNPHTFEISKITPENSKKNSVSPNNSDILFFQPNIPCRNSFKALAFASSYTVEPKENQWIFDCGATDTISFDPKDFLQISAPTKTYVQTAGGDLARVEGAGTIYISPTLRLSNCLFCPNLLP